MNIFNYTFNFLVKDNQISVVLDKFNAQFNMVDKSVNKVSTTINNVATDINNNISGVNSSVGTLNSTVTHTSVHISNQLQNITWAAITDNIRNVKEAFAGLSDAGIPFEQSMADLSSITGITGDELRSLGNVARETGKESGLGASGAANAFALLASQIQVDKIGMEGLKTLQKETITLAQAGGLSMEDSANAMAATINQFGLQASESNRVINVLAAGSKYGAAEVNDLAQSFKVSGAVASAAGLNIEQTAGAIEVLSKNNMKGAEAGTMFRNILIKMQTDLKVDLSKTSFSQVLESLKPKLSDVTFLTKTFGAENLAAAQFLIKNASAVDEMTAAVTNTSVAEEQAAIRTNTTEAAMKRMQAKIDDIKINFFNLSGGVTAYISALGDSAVMISQMLPLWGVLKGSILGVAAVTNRATIAQGLKTAADKLAATWTSILTGLQTAFNVVMSANPIALVVIAIAALVSGIIIAYNHCAKFRDICDKVWASIKILAEIIWNSLVKAFNWLATVISNVWSKFKQLLGIKEKTTTETKKLAAETDKLATSDNNATASTGAFTSALGKQNKNLNTNLATLGGIENRIRSLQDKQSRAMGEQAIALQKEIDLWAKKKEAMANAITIGAANKPANTQLDSGKNPEITTVNPALNKDTNKLNIADSGPIDKISASIVEASKHVVSFNESIWGSNSLIGQWADNATSGITNMIGIFQEFGNMMQNKTLSTVQTVSAALQSMGAMMSSLSGIVAGSAGGWLSWGASLLAVIAAALPQLLALFGVQSAVAVTSQGKLPFPYNIVAMAATVAGIAAAVAPTPKPKTFASGGVVYGNTLAQIGEYPGASNNPEVVAPLDRLKQLIRPSNDYSNMEFRIRGTDLVAIANKVNNINDRTR